MIILIHKNDYFLILLGMFEIEPTTGLITTRNSTIRGLAGEYTVTIGVTDRGQPTPLTGSAQVLISVLVTNNQAPEWIVPDVNNYVAEILEVCAWDL